MTGTLIHNASAMMWAFIYEAAVRRVARRPGVATLVGGAAAVTAVAAVVDLKMVPERLAPGFQHRLSRQSLVLTYGAFAAGLLIGGLVHHPGQGH